MTENNAHGGQDVAFVPFSTGSSESSSSPSRKVIIGQRAHHCLMDSWDTMICYQTTHSLRCFLAPQSRFLSYTRAH